MLIEDYVSFETAKLLKEKGFSENTICKYADVGGITEEWYDDYREKVVRFNWKEGYLIEPLMEPKDQYEIIGDTILAPTLQMVMKWLREVHKLHVEVVPNPFNFENQDIQDGWGCEVIHLSDLSYDSDYEFFQKKYSTHEEACEAGIKYCLENLI